MNPTLLAADYPDGTCVVYVARNAAGDVLYVGKTKQLRGRLYTHKSRFAWWADVARLEVTRCDDEAEMTALETRLISEHRPPHNVVNKNATVTLSAAGDRSSKRALIEFRLGGALLPLVEALRGSGADWREIARIISDRSATSVTGETVRQWFTARAAA